VQAQRGTYASTPIHPTEHSAAAGTCARQCTARRANGSAVFPRDTA
ncbi:MAG: hypothetical protein AVDCRST_MAG93-268, partial [uncultured Chloroflexia bacterium]